MNDARKTKKQLIEELEASRGEVTDLRDENTDLRKQVTGGDVSGVERQLAAERVRAEVASMRSSDDLHRVVGVMYAEMGRLGIETPWTNITFVDEEADLHRSYGALQNPRRFGLDWSSGPLREFDKTIARPGARLWR